MPDLFGLGGLLGTPESTGDSQQASLAEGWKQVLSNPTTQAALLNFGGQLLKPRWNPGSALPDAMGAAGQTVAVNEAEDYKRAEAQRDNSRQQDNAAANRKNQLDIATLNADQRATAAELRASTAIKQADIRAQLNSVYRTPEEDKFADGIYRQTKAELDKAAENAALLKLPALSPVEIDKRAREAANLAVTGRRVQFGVPPHPQSVGPGSEKTSPATSGNPANGKPPAPQSQPGTGAENTRLNSESLLGALSQAAPDYATRLTDEQKRKIEQSVADPENLPWVKEGKPARMAPMKRTPNGRSNQP